MMNNNNLDKLLEQATQETVEEVEVKPKIPINVFITIGIISILIIIALIFSKKIIKPQEFTDKTDTNIFEVNNNSIDGFLGLDYPVKLPTWSKEPFNISTISEQDKTYDELMKFANQQQELISVTGPFPSAKQGDWVDAPPAYTNDITKITIDGVPNPEFSYTLKEDYLIAYANYIHRLINPVFGDWVYNQRDLPSRPMKDNGHFRVLRGMFHPDWWDENIIEDTDYSKLPILADWDGDNFSDVKLAERDPSKLGVWYGSVNVSEDNLVTVDYQGRDDLEAQVIEIITPVKYYAFGENNKILTKEGQIKMTLGANPVEYMPNRVVITDVKLILQ